MWQTGRRGSGRGSNVGVTERGEAGRQSAGREPEVHGSEGLRRAGGRGNMCNWAGSEIWVGGQADCQAKAKGREWIGRGGV